MDRPVPNQSPAGQPRQHAQTLNNHQGDDESSIRTSTNAGMRKANVMIVDVEDRSVTHSEQYLAVEEPLELYLNGHLSTTIFSTPLMLKEHVVGYLLDE